MSAVYVNNLIINTGSSFSQTFTLEEFQTNSLLNLSQYQVQAQMRKWSGSTSATDFTVVIDTPATSGRITLSLTSEETKNLKPGRYLYDVLVTDPYSIKSRVVEGNVLVREGVTK